MISQEEQIMRSLERCLELARHVQYGDYTPRTKHAVNQTMNETLNRILDLTSPHTIMREIAKGMKMPNTSQKGQK